MGVPRTRQPPQFRQNGKANLLRFQRDTLLNVVGILLQTKLRDGAIRAKPVVRQIPENHTQFTVIDQMGEVSKVVALEVVARCAAGTGEVFKSVLSRH